MVEVNEYTHVKTAIAELCEAAGMRSTAADEFAELHSKDYEFVGSRLVHKRTQKEARQHIDTAVREERPHLFPTPVDATLEELAFGQANMSARSRLSRILSAEGKDPHAI